jgi:hypothetical protein
MPWERNRQWRRCLCSRTGWGRFGKEKLVGDLFEQYSGSDDENEKLEIFSLAAWVSGRRALAKDVYKLLQKVTQIPPEDETVEGGTQDTRDECRRFLDKAWAMLPGA